MEDIYVPADVLRYVRTMPGCKHLTDAQIRQLAKHFQFAKMASVRMDKVVVPLAPAKKAS